MARYEHLPIFKDVYDFNLHFFKLSRGFPKDIKYGLSQEIKEQTSLLLDQIILANDNIDKRQYLKKAESCIELIKIKTRMLRDLEVLSIKSYGFIFAWLIKISKQITAWKTWSEKEH
ncbi:MAG: hypothetical protein BWY19_01109 [bacterium ADurb.Bin212]|nr:MAG: hypothetical protein BWY19_01109 [bacterium ADurb.Bin212]